MNNNDILRRLRYCFEFGDDKMIAIFSLADHQVTRAQVSNWLKREEDVDFQFFRDIELAIFLNGLITDRRGKREGSQPAPEKRLNNNIVLRKLKIALNFKDSDILELMNFSDLQLSRHELSAFFRKAGHKHYRECKDQVLRNFLKGLQLKCRKKDVSQAQSVWKSSEYLDKP